MLGFTNPAVISKTCSKQYPYLPSKTRVLFHSRLPEVVEMLEKADCWPRELMLNWIMSKYHSNKDMHSFREEYALDNAVASGDSDQSTSLFHQGAGLWWQGSSKAPSVSSNLIIAIQDRAWRQSLGCQSWC